MSNNLLRKGVTFVRGRRHLHTFREIVSAASHAFEKMPFPSMIQIEPTTRCNFNCIACTRKTLTSSRLNKDLTLEEFKGILKQIPAVKTIKLQGLGEPLLNPQLWQIVRYGRRRNTSFTATSNGSLVSSKNVDKILTYFSQFYISFDSVVEKNVEEIRKGSDFFRILRILRELVEKKKNIGSQTVLAVNFVATHLNYGEIPMLFSLCNSIGIDEINIVEVENWLIPSQDGYFPSLEFINRSRAASSTIRNFVKAYDGKAALHFLSSDKRKMHCTWPFRNCFITADGYVTPCCIRMDPTVFNFGNAFEIAFKDIWNSRQYREFRKSVIQDTPNPVCDRCPN